MRSTPVVALPADRGVGMPESDTEVVESGKLVSSAGLGVDAGLRIVARLHGPAWAEVVRLNMEHEPIPEELRVPRAHLADQALPPGIYSAFPWREAELRRYEGGRDEWVMDWRFDPAVALDSLRSGFLSILSTEEGWTIRSEEMTATEWTSRWSIDRGVTRTGVRRSACSIWVRRSTSRRALRDLEFTSSV